MSARIVQFLVRGLIGLSVLFTPTSFQAGGKPEKKIEIPESTIQFDYFSRTSRYDYRIVDEKNRTYLEMRQTGKIKWVRVEDVTNLGDCAKGPGEYESETFDFSFTCK